jgi:HAMP domain-containing protein
MVLVGIAVALAITLAAVIIIRAKVSIPLRKLTVVSNKLSQGEIEGLTIDIEGKDEISSFGELQGRAGRFPLPQRRSREEAVGGLRWEQSY